MIIGAAHWFFAACIAVLIHLAGVLWLSLPEPSPHTQDTESVSDELVVTLGRPARATAELVEAAESMVTESVSTASEPAPDVVSESKVVEAPDTAVEALPEAQQPGAPDAATTTPDPEPVDTAEPVTPEAAQIQSVDAVSAEPEEAVSQQQAEVAALEAQSATAVEAEAPQAVASVSAETEESVEVETVDSGAEAPSSAVEVEPTATEPEPQGTTAVEAEAPQAAASVSAETGETVEVEAVDSDAEAPSSTVEVEPAATAPTRAADNAPIPEAAAAPDGGDAENVSVAEAGVAPGAVAGEAEVESAAAPAEAEVEAAVVAADEPRLAPAQDEIATVRPEEAEATTMETGAADVPAASDVDEVEVATARQPETAVGTTTSPETVDDAQPETIDLETIQDEAGGSGVVASYAGTLKGWLKESMHYPRAARLAGQEGKAVVRFVIDRSGRVQSIVLESESGYPLLDREAQEMIERGDPFPAIPDKMSAEQLEVRVPVNFNIREETLTKEIPPIYLE